MFVANVTYYFEIFSWNLKKMRGRGEIYLGTDYTDYAVALYNYNTKNRVIRVIRA